MSREEEVNNYNHGSNLEQAIDFISIVKSVIKRKKVFIGTIILCVVIGIFYVCVKKPQYEYRRVIQPAGWLSSQDVIDYSNFQKVGRIVQLIKMFYLPEAIKSINNLSSGHSRISPAMINVNVALNEKRLNDNEIKINENDFIVLTAKGTEQYAGKFQKLFDMILSNIQKNEVNIIKRNKRDLNFQLSNMQDRIKYLERDRKILSKKLDMMQPNTLGDAIQNTAMQDNISNRIQQDDRGYFASKLNISRLKIQLNSIESSSYLHPMVIFRVVDNIAPWMIVLFSLILGVMLGLFMVFLFEFIDEVRSG